MTVSSAVFESSFGLRTLARGLRTGFLGFSLISDGSKSGLASSIFLASSTLTGVVEATGFLATGLRLGRGRLGLCSVSVTGVSITGVSVTGV